jgi:hypothetical protein
LEDSEEEEEELTVVEESPTQEFIAAAAGVGFSTQDLQQAEYKLNSFSPAGNFSVLVTPAEL